MNHIHVHLIGHYTYTSTLVTPVINGENEIIECNYTCLCQAPDTTLYLHHLHVDTSNTGNKWRR